VPASIDHHAEAGMPDREAGRVTFLETAAHVKFNAADVRRRWLEASVATERRPQKAAPRTPAPVFGARLTVSGGQAAAPAHVASAGIPGIACEQVPHASATVAAALAGMGRPAPRAR
jgi:hypothetical protein